MNDFDEEFDETIKEAVDGQVLEIAESYIERSKM